MTICFFGNYLKNYPRVATLRRGLESNGVRILECHTRSTGWKKYFDLYRAHRCLKHQYDFLLVAMGGQTLFWFARLLSSKKVIFDAFASLYLSGIKDRAVSSAFSFRAWYYKFFDWWPCWLADMVLLDTQAQVDYYRFHYHLGRSKFFRLPVSSDDRLFYPVPANPAAKFIVHWHGYIVPFHSVETIIAAADILKKQSEIEFQIITRFNQQYEKIKKMVAGLGLSNVKFYPEVDSVILAKYINRAAVCLGVFGDNQKASVVIPNKIIEAAACRQPLVSVYSPAVAEFFSDRKNILFCRPKDPADLAEKIKLLFTDKSLRTKIASGAHVLYRSSFLPDIIARQLISFLQKI